MNKKGISLIVLVITIIVMIIIAGAIILSLNSSNIVEKAKIATLKTTVGAYNEELQMSLNNALINDLSFDSTTISRSGEFIKEYIPSMKSSDVDKFKIISGRLVYEADAFVFTPTEIEAFKEMGIKPNKEIYVAKENNNIGTFTNYTGGRIYVNPKPNLDQQTGTDETEFVFTNGGMIIGFKNAEEEDQFVDVFSNENKYGWYSYLQGVTNEPIPEGFNIIYNGNVMKSTYTIEEGWVKITINDETQTMTVQKVLYSDLPEISNDGPLNLTPEKITMLEKYASSTPYEIAE